MWATVLGSIVGSILVIAPAEPESEPESDPVEPKRESASIAGGWLQITPLGFGIPGPGSGSDIAQLRRAVGSGFRWGFAAGLSFEPVPHLFINGAVSFNQTVWFFRNRERDGYELCFRGDCYGWDERGVGTFMRVGVDLRLGYTSRKLIAWALVSPQLGVSRIRLDCNNSVESHCDRTETDLGPGIGGGLGVAVRITPNMAVGVESSIDHAWVDSRDDPFTSVRSFSAALILVLRF